MRILFVSCQFGMLNHIDCGAANRSTMFVRALTLLGQVDVISFYKEQIISNIPQCSVIYSNYIPIKMSLRDKILINLKLLVQPWKPQSHYPLSRQREIIVSEYYNNNKYDIVACRYIYDAITCGLMRYKDKLVVDVDDNLTNVYKTNYSIANFRFPWSRFFYIYRLYTVGMMSRWFLKRVWVSFYSNILEKPYENSVFLPNVSSYEKIVSNVTEQTPQRLLIVGALNYLPNEKGTIHFIENIYPLIREKMPDVEVYIAGKTKDTNLLARLNAVEGVKALGFVDDIVAEYIKCRVVVVPIYHGSGTCVKFIEGIMMKRPIVSTPMGARGFDKVFNENEDYMLAKNDEEFAAKVIELLLSIEKINKVANHAYEVAMTEFSQQKFCKIVRETISMLV